MIGDVVDRVINKMGIQENDIQDLQNDETKSKDAKFILIDQSNEVTHYSEQSLSKFMNEKISPKMG